MEDCLDQLRQSILRLSTLLEEVKQVASLLPSIEKLLQEEFRTHHLAEIISFFPEYSLKGLQCRFCVQNKICWRGQTQGYVCGLYFLSKYPERSHNGHRLYLAKMGMSRQWLLHFIIEEADFLDLLILCSIHRANIRILSRITTHGLRYLLLQILSENNSPYLLTIENSSTIIFPYFVQQGETNNAKVNATTNP